MALSPRRTLLIAAAGVFAVSAAFAAFFPESREAPVVSDVAFDRMFAGLCASSAAADDGDLQRAHSLFLGRAHSDLHLLAQALADGDQRSLSARLLEAKNAVEAALPTRDPNASADLRNLVGVTSRGIAATDDTAGPTCPKG